MWENPGRESSQCYASLERLETSSTRFSLNTKPKPHMFHSLKLWGNSGEPHGLFNLFPSRYRSTGKRLNSRLACYLCSTFCLAISLLSRICLLPLRVATYEAAGFVLALGKCVWMSYISVFSISASVHAALPKLRLFRNRLTVADRMVTILWQFEECCSREYS